MAEIRIERKQRSIRPLIIGLVLLVLMIWGLSKVSHQAEAGKRGRGAKTSDALHDDTPPRLRQYALATGVAAEEPASRAAA